jgi:hypothetical protein
VFLDQGREQAGPGFDRDAAAALGHIGETFRGAAKLLEDPAPAACLALVTRLMRTAEAAAPTQAADESRISAPGPSLIIP